MNIADILGYIDSLKRQYGGTLSDIAADPRKGLLGVGDRLNQGAREWNRDMSQQMGGLLSVRPEVQEKSMEGLLGTLPMPGGINAIELLKRNGIDIPKPQKKGIPSKLYRGTNENTGKGIGTYALGAGLYSSPSKSFAKQYGKVSELNVTEAMPSNPLRIDGGGAYDAPALFKDWLLKKSGMANIREFNKRWPDPGAFVKSLGYDGVWIGDEIVKY